MSPSFESFSTIIIGVIIVKHTKKVLDCEYIQWRSQRGTTESHSKQTTKGAKIELEGMIEQPSLPFDFPISVELIPKLNLATFKTHNLIPQSYEGSEEGGYMNCLNNSSKFRLKLLFFPSFSIFPAVIDPIFPESIVSLSI